LEQLYWGGSWCCCRGQTHLSGEDLRYFASAVPRQDFFCITVVVGRQMLFSYSTYSMDRIFVMRIFWDETCQIRFRCMAWRSLTTTKTEYSTQFPVFSRCIIHPGIKTGNNTHSQSDLCWLGFEIQMPVWPGIALKTWLSDPVARGWAVPLHQMSIYSATLIACWHLQ
jgi:hypothetical protein